MAGQIKGSLTISKWVLFTTMGWVAGFVLAMVIAEPLDKIKLEFFGLGLGMATGIGLTQWVALRKQYHIDSKWIWFTIAGLGSSYFLFDILILILKSSPFHFQADGAPFMIIIIFATALGGYITGYLQYTLMLKKYFNTSRSWILYSFLGWTICSLLITGYFLLFGSMHPERTPMGRLFNLLAVFLGGPVIGFTTGKNITIILETGKNADANYPGER